MGPRRPRHAADGGAGVLGLAGGSLILTQLTPTTPTAELLLAYSVFGLGFGMVNPPITNTAVSGMPADQAGVAAAVASTSRLVGISLGVAIIGSIVVSSRDASVGSIAAASHPGWWICVACGLAVVAIALISTTERALNT